jgi:hypothetical protein
LIILKKFAWWGRCVFPHPHLHLRCSFARKLQAASPMNRLRYGRNACSVVKEKSAWKRPRGRFKRRRGRFKRRLKSNLNIDFGSSQRRLREFCNPGHNAVYCVESLKVSQSSGGISGLLFDSEDGSGIILRNVDCLSTDYTALQQQDACIAQH